MSKVKSLLAVVALTITSMTVLAQNDWQSRKDRENAATSAASVTRNGGRWDANAQAERREAARQNAVPLTGLTSCDANFCYGTNGKTYSRNGPGTLISPEGRVCYQTGTGWVCQ